jgi:putative radical SAM enzyme (TIGR03279 family)
MSLPRVVAVTPRSPAARAGLLPGDEIVAMDGQLPRDVIQYHLLADQDELEVEVRRGGLELTCRVTRSGGEPMGVEVDAALFDRVRTCDNHCEFCFIHQLPPGMRRSLYTRDDDYRLSWLYGNFTTLTRFTEADLERVVTEGLSPLWVSIHATDPEVRARMLRNRRGATSLRWLRALLDHGIEVHGQVVVCPGVNDGTVLADTLAGVLDQYPELSSVACVPLGVSRFNTEVAMRAHTRSEAAAVVAAVEDWQGSFESALGHPMVHASDEYYLMSGAEPPPLDRYGPLAQHENGVGMIRAFQAQFAGLLPANPTPSGFFQSVEAAPAEGYRAPRDSESAPSASGSTVGAGNGPPGQPVRLGRPPDAPVSVLTGAYAAGVLQPLVSEARPGTEVVAVSNEFFGGNISVAGLLSGADVCRVLDGAPRSRRYLLPDVCLSGGRFLDGLTPTDLPRPVEVVPANGVALRRALGVRP